MNMKAATVPGDIPIKLIDEFSVELATPLAHILNVSGRGDPSRDL
jgi:hypothetical protein